MTGELDGRVAIVTGAGGVFGGAIAARLPAAAGSARGDGAFVVEVDARELAGRGGERSTQSPVNSD